MTQERIIEQIEQSFSEHTGSNEAILDASYYISKEFEKYTHFIEQISNSSLYPTYQEWWDIVYKAKQLL